MQDKSLVLKRLGPANQYIAEPVPLCGNDLDRFTKLNGLHLSETSFILGVNTAALYSKKNSEKQLSSTLSILLRLFSTYPEYMPVLVPPPPEVLLKKIQAIDPSFKKKYIGPLLGLELNGSYRIMRDGPQKASVTARHLMYIIDKIVTDHPEEWPTIKAIIEIEAQSRDNPDPSAVWENGGWKRHLLSTEAKAKAKANAPGRTAKPLRRISRKEA